jgi:hypothetical protein
LVPTYPTIPHITDPCVQVFDAWLASPTLLFRQYS